MTFSWAIVGTGEVARRFAVSLRRVPNAKLTRVASRVPSNACRFADQFGGRPVESLEALLQCDDVDIVYVATPTGAHAGHATRCIEAGRAVLCEKPLGTSAAEVRQVIDVARARGVLLMEALWTRFLPAVAEVRAAVRSGAVGRTRLLQADLNVPVSDPADPRLMPGPGAGVLLDLGIYPVSFALDLLGPPVSVDAHVLRNDDGIDLQATATLVYPDATAVLTTGFFGRGRNDVVVIGERGRLHLRGPSYGPESVGWTTWPTGAAPAGKVGQPSRIERLMERLPWLAPRYRSLLPLARRLARRDRSLSRRYAGFGYQHEAVEMQRLLAAGSVQSDIMSWDDSFAVHDVLDRIREAAAR